MATNFDILLDEAKRLLTEQSFNVWDTKRLHGDIFAQRMLDGSWIVKVHSPLGGFYVVKVDVNQPHPHGVAGLIADAGCLARMIAHKTDIDEVSRGIRGNQSREV